VFVQDAFGTVHRAHASTAGIVHYLKNAAAGFLVEKELQFLGETLNNPKRPFLAILGGAKVSDKIEVISNLLNKVDALIIGGAMAYTFLKAEGIETGNSLVEADKIDVAKNLLKEAQDKKIRLFLPIDHVVADKVDFAGKKIGDGATVKETEDKVVVQGASGTADLSVYPTAYAFTGHGWGHGVGMSQWGAYGMAVKDFEYQDILAFYYEGARLVDLD
jgi:phosphoglycerate kinase